MNRGIFVLLLTFLIKLTPANGQDTLSLPNIDSIFTTIDLDAYIVTGQYAPTDSKNSVFPVQTITKKSIENRGVTDLQELLSQELNINIQQDEFLGGGMSLQGTDGENIKILIDGVPVIGRQNGMVDLRQINLTNVDRIEVIEGPVSALYGNNALGGVINIITKKSQIHKFEIEANSLAETVGRINVDGRLGARFGKLYVQLHGARNYFDGYSTDSTRSVFWNPKEQYNAGGLLRQDFKNDQTLQYTFQYFNEKLDDLGNLRRPQFNPYAFDDFYYTRRIDNSLFFKGNVFKNYYLDVNAGYNYYVRKKASFQYFFDTNENEPIQLLNDTTSFSSITNRTTIASQYKGKFNFMAGVDLNYTTGEGQRINDTTETKSNFARIGDYGLFASVQYTPFKKLTIQPAVRATYNTDYKAPITPSLNVKFEITDHLLLRGSYARGFRAPSLKELYLEFIDFNHFIIGNQDLKAERSNNYQLHLEYKNKFKDKQKLKLSWAGYFNQFQNKIDLIEIEQNRFQYSNFNDTITVGTNIRMKYTVGDFSLGMGFALNGVSNDLPDIEEQLPTFSFGFSTNQVLTYNWKKHHLSFSLIRKDNAKRTWYYQSIVDGKLTAEQGFIEGYGLMDITVAKQFWNNRIRLTTGVHNIMNIQQTQSQGPVGIHSSEDGISDIGWGRSFFLRLGIRFYVKEKS